ncbi:MAG: nucleotidyltransferase family protein [Planctomycetaceae bacterium]
MKTTDFAHRKMRRKHRAKLRREQLDVVQLLADGVTSKLVPLLEAPEFDFEVFEDLLWDHRLYNLAYEILDNDGLRRCPPAWFISSLEKHRVASTARRARLLSCLDAIDQQFVSAGIDYRLLKGFAISAQYYPALDRRDQGDIDLLVRPDQVGRAIEELEQSGCRAEKPVPWQSLIYINEVLLRGQESKIDLHWSLRNPGHSFSLNERALWKSVTKVNIDGKSIATVSDEYCLVGLLLSISEDIGLGRCRAKLFVDVYLLISKWDERFDWQRFLARRRRENLDQLCAVVLSMLCHLFRPNIRLTALSECLALLPPAWRISRNATWELLQNPRDHPANRVWSQSLRPVTWSSKMKWYVRKTKFYLRFCPQAIPLAILRKLHLLRSTGLDSCTLTSPSVVNPPSKDD